MYKIVDRFKDNIFIPIRGKSIILSDNISNEDLEILYKLNHPGVKYIPKSKKNDDKVD